MTHGCLRLSHSCHLTNHVLPAFWSVCLQALGLQGRLALTVIGLQMLGRTVMHNPVDEISNLGFVTHEGELAVCSCQFVILSDQAVTPPASRPASPLGGTRMLPAC